MEETQKKSRLIYGLLFIVSVGGFVAFLMFKPEFMWVSLPFMGTFLALAMDAI